jgi:hypothetical protein
MKCAYLIKENTAVNAMVNISADKAVELVEQGWIIYEEEIDWGLKQLNSKGKFIDKVFVTQLDPNPYVLTPEETKAHLIGVLNAQYNMTFDQIRNRYLDAQMLNNTILIDEIKLERQNLQAELDAKIAALNV